MVQKVEGSKGEISPCVLRVLLQEAGEPAGRMRVTKREPFFNTGSYGGLSGEWLLNHAAPPRPFRFQVVTVNVIRLIDGQK